MITQSLLRDHDLAIENNHARGDYREVLRRRPASRLSQARPERSDLLDTRARPAGAAGAGVRRFGIPRCGDDAVPARRARSAGDFRSGSGADRYWRRVAHLGRRLSHRAVCPAQLAHFSGNACGAADGLGSALALCAVPASRAHLVVARCCSRDPPMAAHQVRDSACGHHCGLVSPPLANVARSSMAGRAISRFGDALGRIVLLFYGSFDPQIPYGDFPKLYVLVANIPRGILGLLFDQKFGLLMYAPVYVMAVAGCWTMLRRTDFVCSALHSSPRRCSSGLDAHVHVVGRLQRSGAFPGADTSAPCANDRGRVPGTRSTTARWCRMPADREPGVAVAGVVAPRRFLLFSAPHGLANLAVAAQGPSPLSYLLPTFTEGGTRAPLAHSRRGCAAFVATIAVSPGVAVGDGAGFAAVWPRHGVRRHRGMSRRLADANWHSGPRPRRPVVSI